MNKFYFADKCQTRYIYQFLGGCSVLLPTVSCVSVCFLNKFVSVVCLCDMSDHLI